MGVPQSITYNTQHLNALADQIRYTTNCATLQKIISQHLKSVFDLVNAKVQEESNIVSNYLPILDIPGANPAAIVKWIVKLVTGSIYPQMMALITTTLQLIQLLQAIENISNAIAVAASNLEACAIQLEQFTIASLKKELIYAERLAQASFSAKFKTTNLGQQLASIKAGIATLRSVKDEIKHDVNFLKAQAKVTITNLQNDINLTKSSLNNNIGNNLTQVNSCQTAITKATNGKIPTGFDTSSPAAFTQSTSTNMTNYQNQVNDFVAAPTISPTIDKTIANVGDSILVSWTSTNATNVTVNGQSGELNGSQSFTVSTPGIFTVTLVASGTVSATDTESVTCTFS